MKIISLKYCRSLKNIQKGSSVLKSWQCSNRTYYPSKEPRGQQFVNSVGHQNMKANKNLPLKQKIIRTGLRNLYQIAYQELCHSPDILKPILFCLHQNRVMYLFLSRKDYMAVKGCIVFPKAFGNNFTNGFTNESLNIALTSFNRQI